MSYQINLETKLSIKVENCNFKTITISFLNILNVLFQDYVSQVLIYYFNTYYESGKLAEILLVHSVRKKTTAVKTKFKTLFGDIFVPQIQVLVLDFDGIEKQMSITRKLLGVETKFQIPDFMKDLMGWIGSVSTYRVGHNIIGALTNFKCSLMSVWNSVQYYAKKIQLNLHEKGTNEYEADGTGIPTYKSGKRGSELKKVFQRKEDGKLHLVGIGIGKYKSLSNWITVLSASIKEGIIKFGKIVLSCDGDNSIINAAKFINKKVKFQKDLWHVFHQLKYYLWQDGVGKEMKNKIIGHFYKITMLSKGSKKRRAKRIKRYLTLLFSLNYKHSVVYLKSMLKYFYTFEIESNTNIYTSKTERSMRTTNQRINVGVWSDEGALNATKVRLAYYYNGISPLNWKK